MQQMNQTELREIGAQLRRPDGAKGLEIAESMNESNAGMISCTIDLLDLSAGDLILEIGPGNADHVAQMIPPGTEYHGLDIAPTMVEEALRRTKNLTERKIFFQLYDGELLPFADRTFTRIFTVNTIYFWKAPVAFLNELHRVLRPGGVAAITYAHRSFMEELPFTKWDFTFYDDASVKQLLDRSPFRSVEFKVHKEMIKTRTGDLMERNYSVCLLRSE